MKRTLAQSLALLALAAGASAALTPANLRTEWLPNPAGIDETKPRLSWRVEESDAAITGQRQTAFRIVAASSAAALTKGEGDLWDSGKVAGDETLNIEYGGKALASGEAVFWKVRVWDKDGAESPWSAAGEWSMGLLKPEDWKAQWISFKDEAPLHSDRSKLFLPPARHYRKDFNLKQPVKRAMLYVSALGIAEPHLNGERVGDAYFEPGWADYHQRVYYRAHDVTKLVREGANCVGAVVADGWYSGYVGYALLVGYGPNKAGRAIYGKTPALLAQLDVEYADGSREIVGTDATWQTSGDGPVREADLIMGENYDARRSSALWSRERTTIDQDDAWKWQPAIRAEENGSVKAKFSQPGVENEVELGFQKPNKLAAYTAPAIRVTQELPAKKISEPSPGVFVFDFGQNFAGNVRLKVKGAAGTKLTLRYGEMLHPDGRLMTENLRKARATDFYTLRGGAEEVWTPRFTYHGFQYCEVSGLTERPPLEMLTGLVLHNDTALSSKFECSDPVMTQFWKNTVWTQRANFIEIPTDCPQRDERLGWMGDAQIYARTASYNADVAAFFTKWTDDVQESQRDSGAYPDYAPYPFAHGAPGATHGTAWTDAGIIVPYTMWKVYGDTRLVARHWDSMVKFMEWRAKSDPKMQGVKIGNTWGDWLNVNEDTPIEYIDLCYYRLSASLMRVMADALGKVQERDAYGRLGDELRASFRAKYLKADGSLAVDTQTAHVLALENRLMDEPAESAAVAARLAAKIAKNDFRMATGFLGTKPLLFSLSANGQNDLACRLFQSRKFPSWGYEVEQGATSVWERWDSFTKEHGFNGATGKNNAAMNSFSHYSFGAVMQWGFQTLAGIDSDGPGFKRIVIHPYIPTAGSNPDGKPIEWVRASYDHPRGVIASEWKREGGKVLLDVTVPANTSASVVLPSGKVADVGAGRYHFESADVP